MVGTGTGQCGLQRRLADSAHGHVDPQAESGMGGGEQCLPYFPLGKARRAVIGTHRPCGLTKAHHGFPVLADQFFQSLPLFDGELRHILESSILVDWLIVKRRCLRHRRTFLRDQAASGRQVVIAALLHGVPTAVFLVHLPFPPGFYPPHPPQGP